MDRTRRARTRTPDNRPPPTGGHDRPPEAPFEGTDRSGDTGNRWCGRCNAWVEAHYRNGMLTQVVVQHRWYPCRGRAEPLKPADWIAPYVNRHTDSATT